MISVVELDHAALQLQQRYGLTVLAVSLDRSEGEPQVVMDVTEASGERLCFLAFDAAQFGLPRMLVEQNVPDTAFALPDYVAHALSKALTVAGGSNEPVWIRMAAPVGLLPIVPWERLLRPLMDRPVLRLPYHEISPAAPKRAFDCVVCFSSPAAEGDIPVDRVLAQMLAQVPVDLVAKAAIHIFADQNVQPELQHAVAPHLHDFDIRIYDPAETPGPDERPSRAGDRGSQTRTPVSNPWLRWIRRSLKRRSADVVHFLCHCYLSGDEGALALAESPARNLPGASARFVWADELAAFLNDVGAWSVALTSPPGNYSLTGMRVLQDQIARLRPGPCLVHDMTQPDSATALGETYRFLYLPEWRPAPRSAAIALYSHPRRQSQHQRADAVSEELLHDVTLTGRVTDADLSFEGHGWLSTAQRLLEQSAAHLGTALPDEDQASTRAGRKEALRFVADALAKYSSAREPSTNTGDDVKPIAPAGKPKAER
jgi:hypothetical protein